MRTYSDTVHSIRRIQPLTNIFISTYAETDYTSYNIRKHQNATFMKVSLNDVYEKYDSLNRETQTQLVVKRMGELSHRKQYEHVKSVLNFASRQNCDVSIWTRPDVYIAKHIHIIDKNTILSQYNFF